MWGGYQCKAALWGARCSLLHKPDLIAASVRLHRGVIAIAQVEILAVCSITPQSSLQLGSIAHVVCLFGIATKLPAKKPERGWAVLAKHRRERERTIYSHSVFRHAFWSRPCQHALVHALFTVKQHTSSETDEVSWVTQPRCSHPSGGPKVIPPNSSMYVSQQNGLALWISTISEKQLSKTQGYLQVSSAHSPYQCCQQPCWLRCEQPSAGKVMKESQTLDSPRKTGGRSRQLAITEHNAI